MSLFKPAHDNSASRAEVLRRVRRHLMPAVERPELAGPWQTFENLPQHFGEILKAVGGEAVTVPNIAAVNEELAKLTSYSSAKKTLSLVPGVGRSTVEDSEAQRPHDLEDVDYAILPGRFGVAENAAVWLDLRAAKHRVVCVLAQHLAIVMPASEIVPTMHQAYARLQDAVHPEADFTKPNFGLFLSGPSKTADIEQSLVIGAHGARSLTVFLVEG